MDQAEVQIAPEVFSRQKLGGLTPAIVCVTLVLIAPVYALFTWQADYSFTFLRHFSIPVMAGEAIVVLAGIAGGFHLLPALAALPSLTRVAGIAWALAAFVAASLAEARPATAMVLYGSSLLHAIFLLVCWRMFSTSWRPWRARILASIALGTAVYFLIVLALASSQLGNPNFNWKNFGPGVSNVRQLGFYGLTLAGFSAGFLASTPNQARIIFWMALLTLGMWLIYLSGSRAAFGAVFAALALLVIIVPTKLRLGYSLRAVICVLLAVPLSYILVPDPIWGLDRIIGRVFDSSDTDFSSGRIEMWRETIRSIGDRPLLGHGEGQFRFTVETSRGIYNHPHNALLQFIFQWGFIGTIALLSVAARTVASLRFKDRPALLIALPAFGAASALVAMSALEGSLYHVYPTMVVLLCAALIASVDARPATLSIKQEPAANN